MTYSLYRGKDLLGQIVEMNPDPNGISGVLVPKSADVPLQSEIQIHAPPSSERPTPVIVRFPDEPDILGDPNRPTSARRGGGPGLIGFNFGGSGPVPDEMRVKADEILRVFRDDAELSPQLVRLREDRYLQDVPADVQRTLPAGSLRGRSYWTVQVALEGHRPDGSRDVDDDGLDGGDLVPELSP
jgi:hypothetical protein